MPDPAVHLIVFSKDRPLQLHGMLTSVFRHWQGGFRVSVLLKAEPRYDRAYRDVDAEFPDVEFRYEGDFCANLLAAVRSGQEPYTCFGTDDAVYTLPVRIEDVDTALRVWTYAFPHTGFSLRLGRNITHDMFGREMSQPHFLYTAVPPFNECDEGSSDGGLVWQWTHERGDWGYPWEVIGTVYETDTAIHQVIEIARAGEATSPSQLEYHGARRWAPDGHRLGTMRSYSRSRLVVPTVNLVQREFGNGIVGPAGLEPEFLLDCWNRGLRLDVDRFRGMAPPSWRVPDLFLRRAG